MPQPDIQGCIQYDLWLDDLTNRKFLQVLSGQFYDKEYLKQYMFTWRSRSCKKVVRIPAQSVCQSEAVDSMSHHLISSSCCKPLNRFIPTSHATLCLWQILIGATIQACH